ncbi:MAG: TIGR01459 family HAD-type hydrolase [Alphaproteobacteria bacterium]|nr:TIGR01459 family HAD-type hydrolase [Alphaproteobacteria bacterium]
MSVHILHGIREIAADYDGFLLDLWGVLHDGSQPFPEVLDALRRLKAADKKLVILSNAPRRATMVAERLVEIGIPMNLYDAVHSSGEEAWLHLKHRDDPFFRALGRHCYFIGPRRDDPLLQGLDYQRVADVAQADFFLAVGPDNWEEDLSAFTPVLDAGLARGLPMVCANADLVVVHQGRRSICAGAMAEYYERQGGAVRWHGKPYRSVYDFCFARFAEFGVTDRRRIVAFGDSFRTDIAGAAGVGIASVLTASGIHADEIGLTHATPLDPHRIATLAAASGALPTAAMGEFCW